ncbi:MAG: SHD1 domain-containing protein [Planctomycetaceae bacterium]
MFSMNVARWFLTVFVFSIATSLASTSYAADLRTWTDLTGKVKVQAKFVSNENGKITLQKADGAELEIDLKKLSLSDQKFIADLEKNAPENPFKSKEDSPFKTKPKETTTKPSTTTTKPSTTTKPTTTTKPKETTRPGGSNKLTITRNDGKVVAVTQPDKAWKFDVTAESPLRLKGAVIPTPKKADFFEGAKGLVASPNGKYAMIGYSLQKPGSQSATSRLVVCDLESGKMSGEGVEEGKFAPLAIHNDGSQVLMKRDDFGFGNQDRVEIWNVGADDSSKGKSWIPYSATTGGNRDVAWGSFLGDDRVATVSGGGKLIVWDLDDLKAIYSMDMMGGSKPAISPDQKWLAFTTGKEVGILDLAAGEVVAMVTTPQVQFPALAFSPGQKRLGLAAFDRLFVWDFSNGELYREIPYQGIHVGGNLTWPSDDHVLLGNRYLIDLENQVKLWDYQGAEFAQQFGGVTWFVMSDGEKPGALVGAQLPAASVKDALAKAMSAPDFFVLKPGTIVKVDVSGVDAAGKDFVEKALIARLKEAGFDAGPSGSIDLIAQTEVGQQRQISYRTFGRLGTETYNVRDYYSRVKFVYQGKDVWQTQVGSVPGFVRLEDGETMEQFLRKSEKFNFDWFGKLDMPKLLQKPNQAVGNSPVATVGVTKLSTSGVR